MATDGSRGTRGIDTIVDNLNLLPVLCFSNNRLIIPSFALISKSATETFALRYSRLQALVVSHTSLPPQTQLHYVLPNALTMRTSNLLTIFATHLAFGTNANPLDLVSRQNSQLSQEERCGFCAIAVSRGATCSNNGNCLPQCCVCEGTCCAPDWVGC